MYAIAADWQSSAEIARSPRTTFGTSLEPATAPTAQSYAGWSDRFASNIYRVQACFNTPPDVFFIGDSITQLWSDKDHGLSYWNRSFRRLNALNTGVSSDTTSGLLYRLENGEFPDGFAPKLNVLLMGTNNLGLMHYPEWVAEGVFTAMSMIYNRTGETKILLLSILPRGEWEGAYYAERIAATNAILASFADNVHVFYFDLGKYFKKRDGSIRSTLFDSDLVHPNKKGYQLMAKLLEPRIRGLLGLSARARVPLGCVKTLETLERYHN